MKITTSANINKHWLFLFLFCAGTTQAKESDQFRVQFEELLQENFIGKAQYEDVTVFGQVNQGYQNAGLQPSTILRVGVTKPITPNFGGSLGIHAHLFKANDFINSTITIQNKTSEQIQEDSIYDVAKKQFGVFGGFNYNLTSFIDLNLNTSVSLRTLEKFSPNFRIDGALLFDLPEVFKNCIIQVALGAYYNFASTESVSDKTIDKVRIKNRIDTEAAIGAFIGFKFIFKR